MQNQQVARVREAFHSVVCGRQHKHTHTQKPSEHTHNVAIDWQNMRQPKRDVGKQCEIVLPIHRSDRT